MKSSSRNGATVRVAAVHTTEGALTVASLRAFFDRPEALGSSHAGADADGVLAEGTAAGFVPYDRAAWTLRNGNAWSDNLELCAFAHWTRTEWLARPKLLDGCAQWLAGRSRARGIPLVKLSVDQLRQQTRGVIDHDDYTDATGDGTHWDVGESFPWDVVIPRAIALAGLVPVPQPATRRRRRSMFLTSDESKTVYLMNDDGVRILYNMEEVNCVAWLLDETRDPNAIFHFNRRFHDVMITILRRPILTTRPQMPAPVQEAVRRTAQRKLDPADLFQLTGFATEQEPWGPPAPVDTDDPELIQPPPGFVAGVDPHAPGH